MVGVGALVVVAAALVPVEPPVPVGVHTLQHPCHLEGLEGGATES